MKDNYIGLQAIQNTDLSIIRVTLFYTDNSFKLCGMKEHKKTYRTYRSWKRCYYHLSSDGWQEGLLFHNREEYAFGMTLMGLLTLLFPLTIYNFTLMPNHFHILLSGTGEACVNAFAYLKRKLNLRLKADGFNPLPENYCFKLVRVESEEQMRVNYIYIDRNPYEKQLCLPGGYPWGTAYLHYSFLGRYIDGRSACQMSGRELSHWTGSRIRIPDHWQFHHTLGLLPASFVEDGLFIKLFYSPKLYQTRLIKDYEAFLKLSEKLEEGMEWTIDEIREMASQLCEAHFSGQKIHQLSNEEKGRLISLLWSKYKIAPDILAQALHLPEYLVKQILRSKDYGNRTFKG